MDRFEQAHEFIASDAPVLAVGALFGGNKVKMAAAYDVLRLLAMLDARDIAYLQAWARVDFSTNKLESRKTFARKPGMQS
jgi:hypothetical protein